MQNKYKGILLFKKIYRDNDLYVKLLSNTDELITGIVYGGLSKNKRNIFQIGYYLDLNVSFKNNKPASINAELSKPYIASIVNDKYKLNCLMCVTSLINLSIIEGQVVKNIYNISNDFLLSMHNQKKWFNNFCEYLFKLLKIIGYEIDFFANKDKKYFDLDKLEFSNNQSYNTIEFPFIFFENKNEKIKLKNINEVFSIFEIIFTKNHLTNFNLRLPNHYHLFKKLIIKSIVSNE